MVNVINRAIVLTERPLGQLSPGQFAMRELPVPALKDGEALIRTLYLSIDPYMRGRLNAVHSYAAPVEVGAVMTGEGVGEVVASNADGLNKGDLVAGTRGWQTYCVAPAKTLVKIPVNVPPSTYLGVLGMPGVTAYSGLKDIGQVKAGETLVVAAASGAVGSVVGQLAKRAGARAVGVAGGADKCRYVVDVLGFDACVDHRTGDIKASLTEACPNGVDVYFENVGGAVQEAAFSLLNPFARVPMCGMVAQYNATQFAPGPNLAFVVGKRIRIEGFLVFDKPERYPEWRALAAPWIADGTLKYREEIVDGLENAPQALIDVLNGANFGKSVVRVSEHPPEMFSSDSPSASGI